MIEKQIPPLFDEYAESYDCALEHGISVSGEGKEYFAEERIRWLKRCLGEATDGLRIMDYGCGTGTATPYFFKYLNVKKVVGIDVSPQSIEIARQSYNQSDVSFCCMSEFTPDKSFDIIFCNGVFHHIDISDRDQAVQFIFNSLRKDGLFVFWENNPWNIGTQLVMHRIPFDRNAQKICPPQAVRLLKRNSFSIKSKTFRFIFPNFLKELRFIEPHLSRWPLGAQYQIVAQKMDQGEKASQTHKL